MLWKIIGALLALWITVTVVGFVVKSLFWIAVVGVVLAAGTAAYGAIKGRDQKQLPRY
jgi:hypothetical protein